MRLNINGISHTVAEDTGLLDLLADEGIPPKQAIVEVNRQFVSHDDLTGYALQDGDRIEFILPAFGG
jgi:thiamine biosynthesis protein ThiS